MNIGKITIWISAAAAAILAAAGCTEGSGGNGSANETKALFTTLSAPSYFTENGTGHFSVTLSNANHTLHLEFASSPFAGGGDPAPDNGNYSYAATLKAGTFGGDSYWVSDIDGITRKLSGGSFTIDSDGGGYSTIAGSVGGRDGSKLVFTYSGPMSFVDVDPNAVKCLGCYGTYYGPYYIPSASDFYLVLYDTVHAKPGDNYNYRICLDFTGKRATGSLMPESGTYVPDFADDFSDGTFVMGGFTGDGTNWSMPNASGSSTLYLAVDGSFTIRKEAGQYRVFGTLYDRYGSSVSFDYTGALSFDNQAPGPRTALSADLDFGNVHYANQRCYFRSATGFSQWKLWFYDEASWTSKGDEGYFISFDIPLDPSAQSVPAGEYTASEHVLYPKDNNFIGGYMYTDSDPLGTWLAKGVGDGGGTRAWAPMRSGTLSLKDNGNGTFTASFDVVDDDFTPHHVKGTYTGPIPVLAEASGGSDDDTDDYALSVTPRAPRLVNVK